MLQERETVEIDFAFRPTLVKRRYDEFRDFGFNHFESYSRTYELTRRDLTYYFLEQFAKKNLVGFEYSLHEEADGSVKMVSTHYEQFGDVCDMFANARDERREAGLDFSREEAELEGLKKIKNRLVESDEEASVLLISRPPDEAEKRAGYGDYSFVYFGHFDPQERRLSMYAWRNNMSIDEQKKLYKDFSQEEPVFSSMGANDFLRSPALQFGEEGKYAFDRLRFLAGYKVADFYEYRQEIDRATEVLVDLAATGASDRLMNLAQANLELDFVEIIEGGEPVSTELRPKIENFRSEDKAYFYVSSRRQQMDKRFDLASYSRGGCGVSAFASVGDRAGGTRSILARSVLPDLAGIAEFGDYFTCPKCEGKIDSGKGITTCPHCGYTKEQAASEMGIAC